MTDVSERAQPRPIGKADVSRALIDATTELIVEKGLSMSVREIAQRACVNHGLVHTYFGTKERLLTAAFDDIQDRAAAERDAQGFPPPDLAGRRGAELAKALARVMLETSDNPFSSHPITSSWRDALREQRPEMTEDEINERVVAASSLGLGYALFADHLARQMGLDDRQRQLVDSRVAELVAELGAIPVEPNDE